MLGLLSSDSSLGTAIRGAEKTSTLRHCRPDADGLEAVRKETGPSCARVLLRSQRIAPVFPSPIFLTCCPDRLQRLRASKQERAFLCSPPRFFRLLLWADRHRLVKLFDDFFAGFSAFTLRMAEAAAADAVLNIEYQIVARSRGNPHRHCVETK